MRSSDAATVFQARGNVASFKCRPVEVGEPILLSGCVGASVGLESVKMMLSLPSLVKGGKSDPGNGNNIRVEYATWSWGNESLCLSKLQGIIWVIQSTRNENDTSKQQIATPTNGRR
jgi:hypothetical protein